MSPIFPRLLLPAFLFLAVAGRAQNLYTIAGNGVHANQGNNGPALCAATVYPSGICIDGGGSLYLTCSNSIRRVDLNTGIITRIAGSDQYGHDGDNGDALNATLQSPYDVCIDRNNNLYVSEWGGHYIRKIDLNTGLIATVAGTGMAGFSGDGGPASAAVINRPQGIACDDAGNIYFADTYNSRIRKIDAATGVITTIAGTGSTAHSGDGGPAGKAGVPHPVDVSISGAGDIYCIEVYSGITSRLRKIDRSTGTISTVAGNNSYAHSGDGGPATAASLLDPSGLFVAGNGDVYISEYDASRIRKIDAATGIITTIAGTGANGFSGDGGNALQAQLHYPKSIAVDSRGDVYFADQENQRIRKIGAPIHLPAVPGAGLTLSASSGTVCPGSPVPLTAVAKNANPVLGYQWWVNEQLVQTTSTGTYTLANGREGDRIRCVVVTSLCGNLGAVNSNEIVVATANPLPPEVLINASHTHICNRDPVRITAAVKNGGVRPSYQWQINGVAVGNNQNEFSTTILQHGDQVSCTVTADPSGSCGSAQSATSNMVAITVRDETPPSITIAGAAAAVCPGTAVTFTATAANAGAAPVYAWKVNGRDAGTNSAAFTTTGLQHHDTVACTVKNPGGVCAAEATSQEIVMVVHPLPQVSIHPADTSVLVGAQVPLKAAISGSYWSFQWFPAAMVTNSIAAEPLTVPLQQQTEYTLTVTTVEGCSTSAKAVIQVYTDLYMPTAFTPDGDGLNDVFRIPPSARINLAEFSIYDRWGNRLFTTTDPSKGWDGKTGSLPRGPGMYVYVVRGSDRKGPVFLKGSVMLVR